VAQVKALACELPAKLGLPLSRFSRAELRRHVVQAGIVAAISGVTIWRWLHEDALRPLEPPELDLPPRSPVRPEGRTGPGPLSPPVAGPSAAAE
jgi:hypothetical protein